MLAALIGAGCCCCGGGGDDGGGGVPPAATVGGGGGGAPINLFLSTSAILIGAAGGVRGATSLGGDGREPADTVRLRRRVSTIAFCTGPVAAAAAAAVGRALAGVVTPPDAPLTCSSVDACDTAALDDGGDVVNDVVVVAVEVANEVVDDVVVVAAVAVVVCAAGVATGVAVVVGVPFDVVPAAEAAAVAVVCVTTGVAGVVDLGATWSAEEECAIAAPSAAFDDSVSDSSTERSAAETTAAPMPLALVVVLPTRIADTACLILSRGKYDALTSSCGFVSTV